MIKVMLVDDEIAIREGIRNSFPWEESGYTLVGEAPDGEIALPIIRDENPDILITDIRMPFMDGMELCREVKRMMPWIGIVILSGHDDFSYARQAISLGVQEYLLKPITARELREVLDRISEKLRQERRERENAESLRRRLSSGNRFVKDKLLSSLFTDPTDENASGRMIEQLRTLGINLAANGYAGVDIAFSSADAEAGMDALYQLSERSGGSVQVCASRHGARALVMGNDVSDTEERAYAFAGSAVKALEHAGAKDILVAIGEIGAKPVDIAPSMRSARHIRHLIPVEGEGARIIGVKDLDEHPGALMDVDFRPLKERLQYVSAEEFPAVFSEYVSSLAATDIHTSVTWDYLRVEALMTAAGIVREAGGDPEKELQLKQYEADMQPGTDMEELSDAKKLLQDALRYRDAHGVHSGNSSVAKARYYLSRHFTDPNLMLQDVAGAVSMSNSRFSTVFAQETGYTFTEYLAALRIGKAQELLRLTNMRSSQISEAVGYSDPHYFSYLFKKRVGMTPSEYRKQQNENQPK